jgi:hypothetical protein
MPWACSLRVVALWRPPASPDYVDLLSDAADGIEFGTLRGIIRAEQGAALPTGLAIVSPPDPSRGTGR